MTSLLPLIVITAVLAVTVGLLVRAILRNVEQGQAFRRELTTRLQRVRLSHALGIFGLDRDRYVHEEPVVDIEKQIDNCDDCAQVDRCDQVMEKESTVDDLDFCPNHDALNAIRNRRAE